MHAVIVPRRSCLTDLCFCQANKTRRRFRIQLQKRRMRKRRLATKVVAGTPRIPSMLVYRTRESGVYRRLCEPIYDMRICLQLLVPVEPNSSLPNHKDRPATVFFGRLSPGMGPSITSFSRLLCRVTCPKQGLKWAGTHGNAVPRPGNSALQRSRALARACFSGNARSWARS